MKITSAQRQRNAGIKYGKALIVLTIFLLAAFQVFAQHSPEISNSEKSHTFRHVRVSTALYHTYIGTHTSEGRKTLTVPSLGLDVEYWFNEKWGIGSHNDIELINYEVKKGDHLFLERETPLLFTIDALWKPWKGLVLLAGPGMDFAKAENHVVVRGGLEYEIELGAHWDVAPTIFYDSRLHAYDTFSVGIGLSKRF